MSRRQWSTTVVLGLLVVGVCFTAGICSALCLAAQGSWLATPAVPAIPTSGQVATAAPTEEAVSPTEGIPLTATPQPTIGLKLPSPTGTPVVSLVTPPPASTPAPRVPVVPDEWEPDNSAQDASLLDVGTAQEHNLHEGGDSDWLYFEAQFGATYVIETSGLGREVDTVIYLFDGQGNKLAFDDDGGDEFLSSRLWWTARQDGALFAEVRGLADTEVGRGTQYTVSLDVAEGFDVDPYEPDNSRGRASLIAPGETQSHNRHVSADVDWISFEVQRGMTYVVQTLNLGPDADTVIYLYDAPGNELAFDDDGGEEAWASRLEWTPTADGVLYVRVEDWLQDSSGPGTQYEVALSRR